MEWLLIRCQEGEAVVQLPVRPEFEQSTGVVHGGILGMMADTAGYFAAASITPDGEPTTVEFKINLIAPANLELLTARGEVIKSGKSLIVCRLTVTGEKAQTIAVGLGTYLVLQKTQNDP